MDATIAKRMQIIGFDATPLSFITHDLRHAAIRQRCAVLFCQDGQPFFWRCSKRFDYKAGARDAEFPACLLLHHAQAGAVKVVPAKPSPVIRALNAADSQFKDQPRHLVRLTAELVDRPIRPWDVWLLLFGRGFQVTDALGRVLFLPAQINRMFEQHIHNLLDVVGKSDAVPVGFHRRDDVGPFGCGRVFLPHLFQQVFVDALIILARSGRQVSPAI